MITANTPLKKSTNGFPSHLISPDKKDKKWCLQFQKAFDSEYTMGIGTNLRYAMDDYAKWRLYAKGMQPIDQYKQMLTTVKNKGKDDKSWRNLDWSIFSPVPTLVSMVKNKILGQKKDILIRGIDTISQNEERVRKNEMLSYLANQPLHQQAQQMFGIQAQSPFEEGAPVPANALEVQLHLDMYPKDRYVMELYDHINQVMSLNNWKEIWDEVVGDLVEVGVGGTKSWIDITGNVKTRRVMPERLITNPCMKPDFSDMTRIGEYIQMSISELRASVPRGTFTEQDYALMASKASGKIYNLTGNEMFFSDNYRYPYDNEKVNILDSEWFSADDYAYVVEKSGKGNLIVTKQKDPYWLDRVEWTDETGRYRVGVTDEQYVEFNRKKGSERQVIRDSIMNLYGAKWVVGTDFVFDWGLKSNIKRSPDRLGDCKSNYNLYTFFDSFIRRAEPVADDIQRNWLMYQTHVAQSKPSGLKINKRALATVTVGGKGGVELNELDLVRMYAETGSYIYKGEDASGRPYPYDPIQELKGGLNEAALTHMDLISRDTEMLRTIFGLNEATDSSTPNPKLGKAIAEMLEQNTNTALGTIYHAYSRLYEETVKSIALLIPDAEMIKTYSKDESLGESSGTFFRANSDVTFREMGITIEDGPTNEMRQRLQKYIELGIQSGEIRPEDAYLVENEGETNLMRAYHLLALKRRQKMQEDQQAQMANYQAEQDKNIQSAMAAEQAKMQSKQMEVQLEIEKEMALHPLKKELISIQGMVDMTLKEMEITGQLSKVHAEILGSLKETAMKAKAQIDVAKLRPKPKPAARKSA
jgi:hypothetical protein